HLEERRLVLLGEAEQRNQLLQDVILRGSGQIQLDCVFREEFSEFHPEKLTTAERAVKRLYCKRLDPFLGFPGCAFRTPPAPRPSPCSWRRWRACRSRRSGGCAAPGARTWS